MGKIMNTRLTAAVLAVSLLAFPVFAGIPVIDPSTIKTLQEAQKQVKLMNDQINEMKDQLQQAKLQVKALTDINNYKEFAKESVQGIVPDDWQALYDLTNVDVSYLNDSTQYEIDASVKSLANMDRLMEASGEGLHQQSQALEALLEELNNPEGIKSAADLQNRIALQQAALTLNQSKLDQMYRQHEIQRQVLDKQRESYDSCIRHIKADDFENFSYARASEVCGAAQ